jgi:hypothetical protein
MKYKYNMCPYRDNVTTPTVITPTLNTSTVTDSLCNSGAFSIPNAFLLDLHEIIFSFVKNICCRAALKSFKNNSAAYETKLPTPG